MTRALAGIFVGGAASRMGGFPKGLMAAPEGYGTTLIERWCTTLEGLCAGVVLVGRQLAYSHLGMETLADEPSGIGPLGGLVALLRRGGSAHVLALACDMPFVSRALIERLLAAPDRSAIVAARRGAHWEPMCARYDAPRVLPLADARARQADHSLQRLLDEAGTFELELAPDEAREFRDWDTPEDANCRFAG